MKDFARAALCRFALIGVALLCFGLMPLGHLLGRFELLQAAAAAGGLVLIIFAIGRKACRS